MEVKTRKPPGKRLIKNMSLQKKYWICAIGGILLMGYGLCVFNEAGNFKHTGAEIQKWGLLGTYSLVVFMAGVSVFGQAIIFKMTIINRKMIKKAFKKRERKYLKNDKSDNPPSLQISKL